LILRVRTGDEDTSIRKKGGFRMIHASNGSVAKDGEPSIDRESGVIKDRIQVWISGCGKASQTLVSAIYNEDRPIWQRDHAGQDAF